MWIQPLQPRDRVDSKPTDNRMACLYRCLECLGNVRIPKTFLQGAKVTCSECHTVMVYRVEGLSESSPINYTDDIIHRLVLDDGRILRLVDSEEWLWDDEPKPYNGPIKPKAPVSNNPPREEKYHPNTYDNSYRSNRLGWWPK
jgi:hypothetical protein